MNTADWKKIQKSLTEKSFRNLIKSTRNQIVYTIFSLKKIPIDLEPDECPFGFKSISENNLYNLISGSFNKISKIFLCVQMYSCPRGLASLGIIAWA